MTGVDVPGVVTLSQNLIQQVTEVGRAARDVLVERESFLQLAEFLEKLVLVLTDVKKGRDGSSNLLQILEALAQDVENANQLINLCTSKSRIYLLTHCRSVVKQLELYAHSIGRSLSYVPLSAVQGNQESKRAIDQLSRDLLQSRYQVKETEERICRTLEQDEESIRSDIAVQTGILMDIARTVGVNDLPRNPGALKNQIELARNDVQDTRESYDLRMMDVIGNIFESWVQGHDHPSPSTEAQQRLRSRIEPLYDAFVCPLTKQVMVDPVTLENGQTYERSAIERWFRQCKDDGRLPNCPMTGQHLETTTLKPSIAIRNTIEEWTTRNELARIDNARILLSDKSPEDDLLFALRDLQSLCARSKLNKYRIRSASLIPSIVGLLKNVEQVRIRALITLRILAEDDDDNKEIIGETDAIRNCLKCLSRAISDERQEAAALLYELSKSLNLCNKIGATNGAILYLVGITSSKSDNLLAVEKAEQTLDNLERSDANVRQMAENGRVQPLLRHLVSGDEEARLAMAGDLAEIELTVETKGVVAEQASSVLVEMLGSGKLVVREVALRAMRNLSTLDSNGKVLIEAGILPPLMRDLFMVGATQVPMRVKEVCAAVLANVVNTSGSWQTTPIDSTGNTLISEPIVHNLLHLISNTGPSIEAKLLQVLVGLASSPHAVANLVSYIKSAGAIINLINFLDSPENELRIPAVRLLHLLSGHMAQELADGLRVTTRQLGTLVKLLSSDGVIEEQAAAAGLLANLPVEDFLLTRALYDEGTFPILITRIEEVRRSRVKIGAGRFISVYQEGLVAILARFTFTLHDLDIVALAQQYSLTTFFTNLLLQNGNLDDVLHQSAIALGNLSASTQDLAQAPKVPQPKCFIFFKKSSVPSGLCVVHGTHCSAKNTFCLVEAKAVDPLVSLLDHSNIIVVEAALGALSTLLTDDLDVEKGVLMLHEADAIQPILKILQEHRTEMLRQRAIWMVERILRNGDLAHIIAGDQSVHTALVDALLHGNTIAHALAEKCLKHINKIPNFSGVFQKLGPPKGR